MKKGLYTWCVYGAVHTGKIERMDFVTYLVIIPLLSPLEASLYVVSHEN